MFRGRTVLAQSQRPLQYSGHSARYAVVDVIDLAVSFLSSGELASRSSGFTLGFARVKPFRKITVREALFIGRRVFLAALAGRLFIRIDVHKNNICLNTAKSTEGIVVLNFRKKQQVSLARKLIARLSHEVRVDSCRAKI